MKPQSPSFAKREETSLAGKRILFVGSVSGSTSYYKKALEEKGAEVVVPTTTGGMEGGLTIKAADDTIDQLPTMGQIDAVFMAAPAVKAYEGQSIPEIQGFDDLPAVRVAAAAHKQGIPTLIVDTAAFNVTKQEKVQLGKLGATFEDAIELLPFDAVDKLAGIIAAKGKTAGK